MEFASSFARCGFGIALVALAGCGGAQSQSVTPNAIPQNPAVMTHAEPPGSGGDALGPFLSRTRHTPQTTESRFADLYNFGGANGANPHASLVSDKSGALYGTTYKGGTYGYGTVFKLTPSGSGYTESFLYSFKGGTDGASPLAGVIFDQSGALYGTTFEGGGHGYDSHGYGTVFKLTRSGSGYTESVLYSFCANSGCTDGAQPQGDLVFGKDGALYGTTFSGGASGGLNFCWDSYHGCGTVFKVTPSGSGYIEGVLYSLCDVNGDCPNGAFPTAGLVFGKDGGLYGTTSKSCIADGDDCGKVFELKRSGSRYTATTLYDCGGGGYCTGLLAGVIFDKTGALWGTAYFGGNDSTPSILGSVFKLTRSGSGYSESFLYKFKGGADGANPYAGLILGKDGVIYGTTQGGGSTSGASRAYGFGTVFKLTPSGSSYNESVIHRFVGSDGASPEAGLIFDKEGALYGTTYWDGTSGIGTVFKLKP